MTAAPAHAELASGRWHTMSIVAQLANVGSEVHRAVRAHQIGNTNRWTSAFARYFYHFAVAARQE